MHATARRRGDRGGARLEALAGIARASDDNAASAEEVSASTEEQSAGCQEMSAVAAALLSGSVRLRETVRRLRWEDAAPAVAPFAEDAEEAVLARLEPRPGRPAAGVAA